MIRALEETKETIIHNGCTALSAWEPMATEPFDHYSSDTPSEVAKYVEGMVNTLDGKFLIKCWNGKVKGSQVFKITLFGQATKAAAVEGIRTVEQKLASPGLSADDAVKIARLGWDLEQLKLRNEELEQELEEDDEEDDDDETPAQPAVPPAQPLKAEEWVMIIREAKTLFFPSLTKPVTLKGTNDAAPADASAEEAELLRAIRRAKAEQPDVVNGIASQLMEQYGDEAVKARTNGQH